MRFLGKYLAACAAVTLAASPALAAPVKSATSLSVSKGVRTGSHSAGKNELGGSGGYIVAIVAAAAVIAGIIIVANNDDTPNSP